MRVLVTGASGFLGRAFVGELSTCQSLRESYEWFFWDRINHGSLLDRQCLDHWFKVFQPTMVLHLAWNGTSDSSYENDQLNRVWQEVSLHLAEMTLNSESHFIGVGTGLETNMNAPVTEYLGAKRAVRHSLESAIASDRVTWIRPTWVYSRRDLRPRVLRHFVGARTRGSSFIVREPDTRLDFVDVRDVATAILAILRFRILGDVDVGSGLLMQVGLFLQLITRGDYQFTGSGESSPQTSPAITSRPLHEVGWRPSRSLELLWSHE